ncbi:MAG: hypothetical protein AB1411_15885 [Nitrospirota bacterium]
MDIEIGSHLYRNTDGTVEVEGVPQITLTLPKPGGPLLINFITYDEAGRVIAKVVDSALQFNERRAHELTRTRTSLTLKNLETGKVVLRAELKEDGRVTLREGEFRTVRGHILQISPTEWRVEKKKMSGGQTDLEGKSAAIG